MGSNLAYKEEEKVAKNKTSRKKKKAQKVEHKPILSVEKREEIILENYEQAMRVAWKMLSNWRVRMPEDEVQSVVGAALCDAAYRFDPERGVAFQTFFFYHLRGLFIKEITRIVKDQNTCISVPQQVLAGEVEEGFASPKWFFRLIDNNNPERLMEEKEKSLEIWSACADLDPLEQEVLVRVFVKDQALVKVAEELNYCRCHISRVKSKALKKLEQTLNSDSTSDSSKVTKKSYKGGRGRRSDGDSLDNAELLQEILQNA